MFGEIVLLPNTTRADKGYFIMVSGPQIPIDSCVISYHIE